MKLDARRVQRFLDDPGPCRFVLLHGEDAGLIRARAEALAGAVLDGPDDPFRLVWLNREEIARLPEEAAALALTGGRRVVRVRDVGDSALAAVRSAAEGPGEALVILEAGELASRSKLRTFIEALADGAAIACYPEEGRALDDTIRGVLAADGIGVRPDALEWLRGHLGADHDFTRAELGKLALYVGVGGEVDVAAAEACVGEAAALSLDDALFAATAGEITAADRALMLAFAEGAAPVGVLRAALYHLQRLHRARLAMESMGVSAADAARQARPPVFFRRVPAFSTALGAWSSATLLRALELVSTAERECKRTGAPDVTLCRQVFNQLARQTIALRRRLREE
jgi:DNA polymerase III subunit delta